MSWGGRKMQALEEKILKDGVLKSGGILKVDSFLNHQMDIDFINEIGKEFYRRFEKDKITKILTIEASGIGIACITAQYFHVPVVFAKKVQSKNLDGDIYTANVHSYTHGKDYTIRVGKRFLNPQDRILIIDDFLANGKALIGLMEILKQANAEIVGAGICIEKGFQNGGKYLREKGLRIESLAIVDLKEDGTICFRKQEKEYERN